MYESKTKEPTTRDWALPFGDGDGAIFHSDE